MNDAIGRDAIAFIDSLLTPEEKAASELRVAAIQKKKIITARQNQGTNQKESEKSSGVAQSVIAQTETGTPHP